MKNCFKNLFNCFIKTFTKGILPNIKSVFFRIYDPKKFAAIKPIKIKKITKTIRPKPEHLLVSKYLGLNKEVIMGLLIYQKFLLGI